MSIHNPIIANPSTIHPPGPVSAVSGSLQAGMEKRELALWGKRRNRNSEKGPRHPSGRRTCLDWGPRLILCALRAPRASRNWLPVTMTTKPRGLRPPLKVALLSHSNLLFLFPLASGGQPTLCFSIHSTAEREMWIPVREYFTMRRSSIEIDHTYDIPPIYFHTSMTDETTGYLLVLSDLDIST